MTDLENLEALLESWGVPHKTYDDSCCDDAKQTVKVGGYTHQHDPRKTVSGYNGMFTLFDFDAEGKFICMGAWE